MKTCWAIEWLVAAALTAVVCAGCSGGGEAPFCAEPQPPAAALTPVGDQDGGQILPGGRLLTPAGTQVDVGGFPVQVLVNPTMPIAYVSNTGYAKRAVEVIDLTNGTILQDIDRGEGFYGMALSPDGSRLYMSGGYSALVDVYDVDGTTGQLTPSAQIPVSGYPSGLALSADGSTLWVGELLGDAVAQVDTASLTVQRQLQLQVPGTTDTFVGAYGLLDVPSRNELWVSGFADRRVAVIDLASWTVADMIELGGGPQGLAATSDGSTVYVGVTDGEFVASIDTATRTVTATQAVGEADMAGPDGSPLPGSSPSSLLLDEANNRLFVVRAADNAVSILDPTTLQTQSAIPVGWYPTSVGLSGDRLVVTNGKGVGAGPLLTYAYGDETGKQQMDGTVSIVSLSSEDLTADTARVEQDVRRPSQVYGFDCTAGDQFPVPPVAGGPTPIEHIVLLVRENKTYDTLLGDLGTGNGDPSLTMYGENITPNLHALARQFTSHDNFYDDGETSTQGHLWLTSSFVNDYIERTWFEDYRNHPGFGNDPATAPGQPDFGTFFTHLIKYGVSFTNYGEVVGSLGSARNPQGQLESVLIDHTDTGFPGTFFDLSIKDEDKARYVASKIEGGKLDAFTYILLPDDHTSGLSPTALTPEAMINDNDYGTGIVVDAITHSPFWRSTAIFIVEDDSQIGSDHVDYHRSICVVVSPWAKHAYTSHVHTSIPSLFRTFELILGLPPMNRFDANATPLYDDFATTPDMTTYDAIPRTVADQTNALSARATVMPEALKLSAAMDFSGPDRNEDLGAILAWAHYGTPPKGSHLAHLLAGTPDERNAEKEERDDAIERDVYDAHWRRLRRVLTAHPELKVDPRLRKRLGLKVGP